MVFCNISDSLGDPLKKVHGPSVSQNLVLGTPTCKMPLTRIPDGKNDGRESALLAAQEGGCMQRID